MKMSKYLFLSKIFQEFKLGFYMLFLHRHIYTYLNRLLKNMSKEQGLDDACYLTKDLHVLPDFHGNRSPIADSNLKGMVLI